MGKTGAALLGLLILSGCALPVPVRLASWAIDAISYLATKKSVADHGISVVAERDCAMWRGLTGNGVCVDNDAGSSTAVAEAEAPDDTDDAESLASFETAAGIPASEPNAYATPRVVVWLEAPGIGEVDPAAASWQTAAGESDEPRATDWQRGEGVEEIDPAAASFSAPPVEGDGRAGEKVGARRMAWPSGAGLTEADDPTVIAAVATLRGGRTVARFRADASARRSVARPAPYRVVVWLEAQGIGEVDPAAASWQTAVGESDEPRATDWQRGEGVEEIDPAAASFSAPPVEGDGRAGEKVGARRMAWPSGAGLTEADDPTVIAAVATLRGGRTVARFRADASARRSVARPAPHRVALAPRGASAPPGIYFVVGSFRSLTNARRLARRHVSLEPVVMSAELDGGTVFRVMVGPFTRQERQDGRRRVVRAGIYDAWAISLDSEDWRMAGVVDWLASEVASTAGVVDVR